MDDVAFWGIERMTDDWFIASMASPFYQLSYQEHFYTLAGRVRLTLERKVLGHSLGQ